MKCHKFYDAEYVFSQDGIPKCSCQGIIKPDVVLYEEGLDSDIIEKAIIDIENADLMIILGTSLNVYPAAGLIRYFRGKTLAIINKDVTSFDHNCDIVINDDINNVFSQL